MGSGQSVAGVQEHLQRWETALSELEQISQNTNRLMDQDRIYGTGGTGSADGNRNGDREDEVSERGGRRPSSLVSFNNNNNAANAAAAAGGPQPGTVGAVNGSGIDTTGNGVSTSSLGMHGGKARNAAPPAEGRSTESKAGFSFSNVGNSSGGPAAANDGTNRSVGSGTGQPKHTRQQVLEVKKGRTSLFKSYEAEDPSQLADVMQCSHFGAAAVALSYLLDGAKSCKDRRRRVTVEDIFFAAQVPLHMLHTSAPHLPVMADILREFLDVDNRFKDEYSLEETHLDISPTVGQVDLGPNEVGDRQTRIQLPEFRRVITQDCEEETQVICIVNYDPYVLEQEMLVDAYEDEDERNSPLATSVMGNPRHQSRAYSPQNDGAYAAIVDVRNAVQLMVTIAEGVVNDSLHVKLTEVPVASLFKAMMSAEEGHRARGFMRIFKKDSVPEFTTDEIRCFWTPELCSGKVLGTTQLGTHASVISHHISPHIVGVAWAMHLLGGVRAQAHGYGNGLPVSDIIRTMQFPAEVFIDGTLPLDQVYEYARDYIKHTNRPYTVNLYPVLTKIFREDAVPTISVFDLESILIEVKKANEDPESPECVMLIMYNAGVAHNVLYVVDVPQWCVLAGYDQESQTALLIDAHPKTFCRTWSCPLDRLHKAITGSGYVVFSKTSPASRAKSNDSSQCGSVNSTSEPPVGAPPALSPMVEARLQLIQKQSTLGQHGGDVQSPVKTFVYPSLPVMLTIIALACTKLGFFTTFEDVVQRLPFDISSLIIRAFTLESLHVCLTQFLHFRQLDGEVYATVYHGDCNADGDFLLYLNDFNELVETAVADNDHALIVLFDPSRLQVNGACNPFGCLGLVTGYDREQNSVTVSDLNPNSYLRTWVVPLHHLFEAISDNDKSRKHRVCGCLMVTRGQDSARARFPAASDRPFQLELLPVQNVFHVSPSPHFQGMSLAFSQLGHFYSPEEIFYEAYLKTMNDQRRRGSQAFAWRDVDVSLSVINKEIDAAFMAQVCRKFLESRNIHKSCGPDAHGGGLRERLSSADGNFIDGDKNSVVVERLDEVDVGEELQQLLLTATTSPDVALLLNFDVEQTHNIPNLGRSVALVKAFDPAQQLVELWDAEYGVFGLSCTVSVEKLIKIADLENEGHSPFGFVKFSKGRPVASGSPKRRGLMPAPQSPEEEEAQDATITQDA